jgi:5,10-methylenetetrahydrofolate reductase
LQPNGPRQSRESLDRLLADAGAVSTDAADDKTLQGGNDSQPRKYARLFSRIRKRDLNRPVTHIP